MKHKMFARLTPQGTAAAETAVCQDHLILSPESDDTTGPPVRCIGNDALECVVCGVGEEGAQYVVLSGNPVDGLTHTGPFNSSDLAGRWAEEGGGDEWWIVTLESPEAE